MHDTHRQAIEDAADKILGYLANPTQGQTNGHLVVLFGFNPPKALWAGGSGLPYSRVLDRALQKLRKQGKIRYERRHWVLA